MKKNLQRLLGALLAVVLLVGAVPALAASDNYSAVTLTTYDQTIVFDEAYTKNPVTIDRKSVV